MYTKTISILLCLFYMTQSSGDEIKILRATVNALVNENEWYRSELGRLSSKLEDFEARFETELSKLRHLDETSSRKRLLMTDQPGQPVNTGYHVAFNTQLNKNLQHLTTNQIVVFDSIHLNHGNSYSSLDGEFVCTMQGTYFMTWTITCSDNTAIETELVVNGNVKGHVFTDAGNHADYETNSGSVVLELNVGDRVWIRIGRPYHGQIIGTGLGSSTFSGFLVRPENYSNIKI